jgi:4-carboxymuconolactone decarboxylase
MIDERFEAGINVINELFPPTDGQEKPQPPYPEEIAADFAKFSVSTVMGDIWGREGLDKSKRALITIGALTVMDKPQQLKSYIEAALTLGVSRGEISEAIMHVSVYGGVPSAIQALAVAKEVFES